MAAITFNEKGRMKGKVSKALLNGFPHSMYHTFPVDVEDGLAEGDTSPPAPDFP